MTAWDPERRLLTAAEAGAAVGRPASTVRRWVAEGRLRAHARTGRAHLYLEADVLDAERDARQADTRR